MWEYYVSIYFGLMVMLSMVAVVCFFTAGSKIQHSPEDIGIIVISVTVLILSMSLLTFLPNDDYAKTRACFIENVNRHCKE